MHDSDQMFDTLLAHQDQCTSDGQPRKNTKRVIDVYVIDQILDDNEEVNNAQDEPSSTVESTLVSAEEESSQHTTPPFIKPISHLSSPQQRPLFQNRYFLLAVVAATGLLIGTAAFVLVALFPPIFSPSATVVLLTTSRDLTTQTTLTVTNGTLSIGAARTEIQGRMLDAVTMRQTRTVATTGLTHQKASAASGFLTFYNAAPFIQTVNAGTLVTTPDGVQVITDQSAAIPPAVLPTEGQVSVLAHAAITGPHGNIQAGDIYGTCCRPNVFVANTAFHGGQDARTYQSISAQDVTSAATKLLTKSLTPAMQAVMHAEVHADETLLTPIACTLPRISSTQPIGAEATQVTVGVEETCQGEVYNTHEFQQAVTQSVIHDAQQQIGTGYVLKGVSQMTISSIETSNGNGSQNRVLFVTCRSTWVYLIRENQQQQIKEMLLGKHENEAIARMLHEPGVQGVSISLTHGMTLPQNAKDIALIINPT